MLRLFVARGQAAARALRVNSSIVRSAQPAVTRLFNRRTSSTTARPHPSESFVSGTNGYALWQAHRGSVVLESLYDTWKRTPDAVHVSWGMSRRLLTDLVARFFERVEGGAEPGEAVTLLRPEMVKDVAVQVLQLINLVITLMRMFRVRGHLAATTDPLGLNPPKKLADLQPETYGFTEADLDREFTLPPGHGMGEQPEFERVTLRHIVEIFRLTYCGTVGVEFYHMHDPVHREWLQRKLEVTQKPFTREEKLWIYSHLQHADRFENFLSDKFQTMKRFGVEGGESLLPALEAIVLKSSDLGIESLVLGMPHRGRLNTLGNVMKKNFAAILQGFTGKDASIVQNNADVQGSGDVKYHLGTAVERTLDNGKQMAIALCPNPSHLEAVDPIVEGRTRAQQFSKGDRERKRAMSVLMHGDAAFAGQGVVPETLAFSDLRFFRTGGTVHVIVNNQIGFTTDPSHARSSPYPSDIAKGSGMPIFHVNGDDPEAVVRVSRLAVEWRQKFNKSVVIDLVCYRRHGHNESDEPMFTQPRMYQKIKEQPTTLSIYRKKLLAEGFKEEELQKIEQDYEARLEAAFKEAKIYTHKSEDWTEIPWKNLQKQPPHSNTGVEANALMEIGRSLITLPEGFNLHRTLANGYLKQRRLMVEDRKHFDWAFAEALAFGSLMRGDGLPKGEGIPVRLSGQDVERGTFSHRHAVLHDQVHTGGPGEQPKKWLPLDHLSPNQKRFSVANSNLSEYAVLGFEYGMSLENPNQLNLWEAQFGDFANGAQIIFDQFLSSAQAKWYTQSGLVCLLPHGYDGQGPEHSSCRLERFLQLSDEDPDLPMNEWNAEKQLLESNWQVANASTSANYFHLLRRQICRNFRKPLIVASPKKLLRLKEAMSNLEDFLPNTKFNWVIPDSGADINPPEMIKRVVFCSGQVYYDIIQARKKANIKDIAVVRVEQLAPFPFAEVRNEALKYPKAEVMWAQEEPKNMGAWAHIRPRFENALQTDICPKYAGRPTEASPATGWADYHKREVDDLLRSVLTLGR